MDFVTDNRWKFIVTGLGNTMKVALLALFFGMIIGAIVAVIRVSHDQMKRDGRKSLGSIILDILDFICRIYLTVIRGTPALTQLLIFFFIILTFVDSKIVVAIVAFSINSGAYNAEIFRSGIMAVDGGQMEAGRSLGLSYTQTMLSIIMPQAIKNCLPSLINEMITLFKETSICGFIGLNDLNRGGDIIRGTTFDALLPLLTVAAIYLVIVMFFTFIMGIVERKLRESDIR
ncbi:MAG: amino acid ABC transporter permease [Eubacteriales bacterium]|nr:amino acid ABC transporter permease [Eubacteriales bacterium]